MELVLGLCLGIGLAAACGFRVFLPMFALALAARMGQIEPADGFDWLASWPAVVTFGVATLCETVAYYVPWLDNILDTAASPAAVVAGITAAAASMADAGPLVQWTSAVIAGGGAAGLVQAGTVTTRAGSTLTTGGLGNFVVATLEWVGSLAMSLLALLAPVFAAVLALGIVAAAISFVVRRRRVVRV